MVELEDAPVSAPAAAQPAPEPKSGEPAGGKGKEKDDAAELRAEISRLQKSNQELAESERYWAGIAAKNGHAAPEGEEPEPKTPAASDDEDYSDPAKFVDALSTKGPRAIASWLKKEGYITAAEAKDVAEKTARQAVAIARRSMEQNAELVGKHPELGDEASPLFKETQKVYQEMVKRDPELKKSSAALIVAADLAAANIKLRDSAKRKPAAAEEDDEAESERTRRIRLQAGDRSRRSGTAFEDEGDDSVSDTQRTIAERLGLKVEDYKAERKKLRSR